MTTVQERLNWWRQKSYYLGDSVSVNVVNYKVIDSDGNLTVSTTAIVDITIYTKSGRNAVERMERWIVPDADAQTYLDKPAYYRRYTVSNTVRNVVFIHYRRRWRW